ncbi:MAG: hypothetical protein K8S99_10855 [Planctomycetes bacterium]|nr:hypothetical protein [Planctomycetota bacterium]
MPDAAPPRFLVTAGSTRERIDDVRDWGNIFTGNTGLAIARALAEVGEVDLLTANRAHVDELLGGGGGRHLIHATGFTTHAELKAELQAAVTKRDYAAVFMSAAVSDYSPKRVYEVIEKKADASSKDGAREVWVVRDVQKGKVSSAHRRIAVLAEPTEKLVDLFRGAWGYRGLLVKFKLEVGLSKEELIRVGQASRRASGAEYLVANTLAMVGGPEAGAYLLSEVGEEWVPRGELAARLAAVVREAIKTR